MTAARGLEFVGHAPLDELMPKVQTNVGPRFAADCAKCPWQGPVRGTSLRALADYDRHVATLAHRTMPVPAPTGDGWRLGIWGEPRVVDIELCVDCDHPVDGHDRRKEDGGACDECIARNWGCL